MLRRFQENCRFCVAGQNAPAQCRQRSGWRSPRQPVHPFPHKPVVGVPSIIAGIVFVVVSYAADIRACAATSMLKLMENLQLNFRPEGQELRNS